MKGDFTRFTHAPQKAYTGVLEQQGRVRLDADFNEDTAIRDRLRRTTNIDVIGRTGAPENDAGFAITASAEDLGIGAGRMYVDGILCELDDATTYSAQPFPPTPVPLGGETEITDGRTDLVYLDVWQRHVTAVEDPDLLDPALNGLDTTTRIQTVWQVRVAADIGDATCAEALADLPASRATLTSGAVATPEPDTPCDIVVAGGYRGVENRLYRVEIHDGGSLSDATWKWSRDNGSVVFAIEEFLTAPANRIRLRSPGRDRYLALRQDDWVEIHDDGSELAFSPGFMARVSSVDESTRIVTLDRDVPATFDASRNARVRRWDQVQGVDGDGLLGAAGGTHDLEDGVQVTFGGSEFRTGDWWAFAARTADGAVEVMTDAPAAGIAHHYAALARIQWNDTGDGIEPAVVEDCRETFPPLTDICADDVCFDNGNCALPGAKTVQDAIDQLCGGRDLKWHNRHLHGWGVVCGLQVVCGPDADRRRHVTVRSGYALDCDGTDLVLKDAVTVDLLDRIQALDRLDPNNPILDDGDGEVCLILGKGAEVEVEKYTPPTGSPIEQALKGTLLQDVIDGCIRKVFDFLKEQLSDEDKRLVGPGRKRLTTFLNLAIQYSDRTNGRHVWLSAEEDRILREFYPKLRELLRSRTYCAMFENARPLPDYPFRGVEQPTIFGKGNHSRLRARPGSPLVYTAGRDAMIHAYDTRKQEMVAEIEFPGGTGVVVRDVAFAPGGRQMYAIATLGGDTLFGVADIAGDRHTFKPVTVMRDVELVTLLQAPDDANVLAIGKGSGLYEINPNSPPTSPKARHAFNAVGHLVIDPFNAAWATARAEGTPDRYDRLVRIPLKEGEASQHTLFDPQGVARSGTDDLMVAAASQRAFKVYVVVDSPFSATQKDLLAYSAAGGTSPRQAGAVVPLGEGPVRLGARETGIAYIADGTSNTLRLLDTVNDRVVPGSRTDGEEFVHPAQIAPGAVVANGQGNEAYVLNVVSNTISVVPSVLADPKRGIDMAELAKYRDGMLAAYADLLAGFLQYLKDCFCDHLLIACPECDDEDRVYLGCVSIRAGQVYRVCNFSRRRYVKSSRAVERWLSLVPILPLLGLAVEKFCCAVLPDVFGRFEPANTSGRKLSPTRMTMIASLARRLDPKSLGGFLGDRFDLLGDFTGDWLKQSEVKTEAAGQSRRDTLGQRTADAKAVIEATGGSVVVQPYEPGRAILGVFSPGEIPREVRAGEQVILYEDRDGVVRNWAVAKTQPAPVTVDTRRIEDTEKAVREASGQLADTRNEVGELRDTVGRVANESAAAIDAKDREIAALKAELQKVASDSREATAARERELAALRTDLDKTRRESAEAIATRDRQIEELVTTTRKFETQVRTLDQLRSDVELLKRR